MPLMPALKLKDAMLIYLLMWCTFNPMANFQPPSKSPIGTRKVLKSGYVRIRIDHPDISKRWPHEHRVVWEAAYGPLPPGACVHHINHDRADNRLENLELCPTRADHYRHHTDVLEAARASRSPDWRQRIAEKKRRLSMKPKERKRLSIIGRIGAMKRWHGETA